MGNKHSRYSEKQANLERAYTEKQIHAQDEVKIVKYWFFIYSRRHEIGFRKELQNSKANNTVTPF